MFLSIDFFGKIFVSSSNVNEVIREVLNFLFLIFFTKRFHTHKKHKKHKDAAKQKHEKITKTQPGKSTKGVKSTKAQISE